MSVLRITVLPRQILCGVACAIMTLAFGALPEAQEAPEGGRSRYERLFRALDPTVIVEIRQAKLNETISAHPEDLDIPEGYEDPRVDFSPGSVEASARTKFLFIVSRVRVRMVPQIRDGRLRLVVSRVHAGRIRIPSAFHRGVAGMIETPINQWLEDNDVRLQKIEITNDIVRATARMVPQAGPKKPVSVRSAHPEQHTADAGGMSA